MRQGTSRDLFRLLAVASGLLGATPCVRGQGYTLLQIDGSAPYDMLGLSVAGVGDSSDDGVPDVLVGVPGADPGGLVDAGSARVYSGADGSMLLSFDGLAAYDYLGTSVAAAADIDGDGKLDLIVGAPGDGNGGAGYAKVFSGASGATIHSFVGVLPGDRFGAAVGNPGRVDMDSIADILVGAPRQGSGVGPGYAKVYSGVTGALFFTLDGTAIGDSFGSAVAGAGDLNGDLRGDLLVGAPTDPQGGLAAGSARIFSGLDGAPLAAFIGGADSRVGYSVLGPGDLNLDGVPDQMIGSPTQGNQLGYLAILSGASGTSMQTLWGSSNLDWFAFSVAMAGGDGNADGFVDYIVGAPGSPLSGSPGYARVFTGILIYPVPIVTIAGSAPGDLFGWSVSGAGDVDGDGVRDFVVGAPGADPAGIAAAGSVRLVSAAGVPPGSAVYGNGCPGPAGETPRIATVGGNPVAGSTPSPPTQSFAILVTKVPPGKTALLILGFSNQAWGPSTLPLNLGFLGLPACSLLVSPFVLVPRITAGSGPLGGAAAVGLPLPGSASLAGSHVYFQWFLADPGPAPVPASMSRGLDLVIL